MSDSFSFSKPLWRTIKDKKLVQTPIFDLQEKYLDAPGQTIHHPFYVLNAPDWINIIALTDDKPEKIVLVEQYRAGIHESTLEIPGGMVDSGEDPLKSAKRELKEETGFESDTWISMGSVSSNPAILSNRTHLFVAKNCIKTAEQNTDGSEDIAVHLQPMDQFLSLTANGTIHHAIVVAAVGKYLLHQKKM
jgi:8-oxo-dGTP pyrophosphatase MutT (NUDIX family)